MKSSDSRFIVCSVLVLCLSGCISAGAKKTVVYTPQVATQQASSEPAVTWQIRIDAPSTSDFLDSTRIAVRRGGNVLQVFEGARWSDNVPDLLQDNVTQNFNDSGKITAVAGLKNNTVSDALLLLDIRQFEAVYEDNDRSATAVISVQAKVQSLKTNRIIASKHFLVKTPAAGTKIPQVMSAFDSAMQQLSEDILTWTLTADIATRK